MGNELTEGAFFKLLQNGRCFMPEDIGAKDVLIVNDKICAVKDQIEAKKFDEIEVIDCSGCLLCPGIVDQHVHILGGGGEQGPISRIPEIMFSEVVEAGVTTVVGVLGFDSITRSIAGLLAKARGLEKEGISTYIYSGSYGSPTETLTGRVLTDIVLLDKVIGAGEVALADYRSNHPSLQDLRTLAAEVNAGGMLGDKAGVLHLHLGEGKEGLGSLFRLIDESDFPIGMFVPTHINRSRKLFNQGLKLLRQGGNIDLTAGEAAGLSITESLSILLAMKNIDIKKVTLSSDGNGSAQNESGVCRMNQLLIDIQSAVLIGKSDFSAVISTVTANPARVLKLFPRKGSIMPGADADILVLAADDLTMRYLLAKGQIVAAGGQAVKKGRYEN